ncbi:LysR family transcriptional regulator [Paraburkholderia sp. MMS20-SJTN17]|uniref:LysR family transcriptional regulator n=1 Tax=Paraburkholderia translucens TaxID=2886945 RepID=A0ABS8KBY6_9BURK|nr:LysR substrate-binding domain-containing protein [Paraburkholderia sp. MMS20-SJTN17]MCC8402271.1 LysR family transcriptional regulator [Paraburkholderia sp. MMS20-SJTN17]
MELHQLEAFSAVMSSGSMTGAARLLSRSQPAVTRAVQDLEQEIGYALFDRKGPRVTPTSRAFLLYSEVERSLVGLDTIRASARAIGRDEPTPLRVVATPALAAALAPRALAKLARDHPPGRSRVDTQLRSVSAEQVAQALLSRAADIGIATLPLDHAALDVHYIIETPCVAVLHRDHPLARHAVLPLACLDGQPVATLGNRYRLRNRIDRAFDQASLALHVVLETNASLSAMMAAQEKLGVAIVDPVTAFGMRVGDVEVKALDTAIPFLYGVVTLSGRLRSTEVDAMIETLAQVSHELLPGAVRHAASQHGALVAHDRTSGADNSSDTATLLNRDLGAKV